MDVTLLLCDHAEAVNGKLYINGGGWNIVFATGQPMSFALALLVEVPWDRTNIKHRFRADLLTQDGVLVQVNGNPLQVAGEFELGRPPGIKPGTSLNAPLAANLHGIVLQPGGYEWRVFLNDESVARRPFAVMEPPFAGIA